MKATVDKIEGSIAVLLIRPEEKYDIQIPIQYLPNNVEEGSILQIDITIDQEETDRTEERIGDLIDKLKNKNNKN